MNVLMVTDKMQLGGAETHVATLVERLISMGISVTLLSGGGVWAKRLEKIGATCVFAPLDKRDPASVIRCARIMREEMKKADIIHTHTRFSSSLATALRGEAKYPPIVTTAHLNFPTFPFGRISFYGDRTIAVSSDIKEHLIRSYSIDEGYITVTKNSIDPLLFGGERHIKKLIVHTSRIDRGRSRCAFALVSSAPALLKRFPEHKILIIGTGNCFGRLKAAVERANEKMGKEVIILAGQSDDVPSLLSYAEVFVGVSRAALEAMAFGIPTVIAGDEGYGGIASEHNFDKLSRSNFCARGLESLTCRALTEDISLLLSSPTERHLSSEYCRGRVLEDYTPTSMAKDAISAYKSALVRPRVCLIGYFGYGNLGDEESLNMAVKLLRGIGITHISVLTRDGEPISDAGLEIYDRMNPYDIAEAIRRSDVLVLAGGNLLQNETSKRSLFYYTSIVRHAKNAGKRIIAISSGIGSIHGAIANGESRKCLASFYAIGLRSGGDINIAKRLSAYPKSFPMPDLCYLLKEGTMSKDPTRFGIILSGRTDFTLGEIALISRKRSLEPLLISLFPSDDLAAVRRLGASGISVCTPRCYTELCAALSGCAFTLTERLHGAIFSVISHTPTYIRATEGKNLHQVTELSERAKRLSTFPVAYSYSADAVLKKKEVGVTDSDFSKIISDMQADIYSAANRLFGLKIIFSDESSNSV